MQDYSYATTSEKYLYRKEPGGICITACRSASQSIEVPESIEGEPVIEIGKKAFLSNKGLVRISLPESLEAIGDWAYSYCSKLQYVLLPRRELRFGTGIFKGCHSLRAIQGRGEEAADTGYLLAAAATMLRAPYLLSMQEAGTGEWIAKWDAKMLSMLREDDREGYTKMVLCGEEDVRANAGNFITDKRKAKARLCFLRLKYCAGLGEDKKKELLNYVQSHTKGCDSEEAWEVIYKEYADYPEYYRLFADSGCLTEANLTPILEDLGEGFAQMKAFFLRYREEHFGKRDFLAALSLDF